MVRIASLRFFISGLVVVSAGLISTCCAASHPYHVSHAEVNWNPNSGNFEVALCVWPADLEKAISRQQGEPVDLDKIDNLNELMERYIQKTFLLRPAKMKNGSKDEQQQVSRIRWIGHEKSIKEAWLYFEITGMSSPSRWTIENRVFFELNEDQMNQVELTVRDRSNSVICIRPDSKHLFSTERAEKTNKRIQH